MLLLLALAQSKMSRKKLGHAVHFCPICRDVTVCRAVRVKIIPGMSFSGATQRDFHEMTCQTCKSVLELKDRPVTAQKKPIEDAQAWTSQLLSDEAAPIKSRATLEERAASGELTPEERRDLIAEPLLALDYELTQSTRRGCHHALTQSIQLCLVFSSIAALVTWISYAHDSRGMLSWAIGLSAVTALFLGLAVHRGLTARRRMAARRFAGRIAQTLRVLGPTEIELQTTLASLTARGLKLASNLEPRQLMPGVLAA